MAQDAELKLKVSLDLAFFRQQLNTIGTQLGGQSLQLNVQFNKKSIADQYQLLGRYLERKTFKIKVESNTLDVLVAKVSTFKKNLEKLGGEIVKLGVNVESEVTKTKAAEVRRNIISDITGPKGVVFIPIEVKPPFVKNIKAIRDNIKDRLSGISIDVNVNANIPKGASGGSRPASLPGTQGRQAIDEIEKVLAQGASGALFGGSIERAQQNVAKQAILKRLEKESLGKGGYNKPGLEKIIRDLGGTPSGKREDLVAQAKKLVQESDGIADAVFDHLKDLQMKLRPIRGQAQTSAARSMPNLNQMLDRIANLTENPRAAQRMLRMMPESRLTTDLIGAANRQAAFREQYGAQGFRLPGFGGAKAFDPLLKSIAESFSDYTRTVNTSNPWMGKIGSGITTLISRALTQSPEQMFGGRTPVASAKLLPAAGQTSGTRLMREQLERANLPLLQAPSVGQENAPLSRAATYMLNRARRALELPIGPYSPYEPNPFAGRATVPSRQYFTPTMQAALPPVGATGGRLSLLEQQLAQSRGALGTGGGVAGSLFTGRALINPGISMLSPVGISGNYRQMAAALANQAANPALAHRQIADIGFGGVPTAATGMSGEALNRALNQAFLQRRGLGIGGGQSLPIFNAPGVAVQQNIPGMGYRMGGGGLGGSMGMFPSAGMMGPSSPLTINAQSSMFGGGGGNIPPSRRGGTGGFGGMSGGDFRNLMGLGSSATPIDLSILQQSRVPLTGAIKELGQEFGFAIQQVLLFGTAYKALAFFTNLPGEAFNAAKALATYKNQLQAVTSESGTFERSFAFVDNLSQRFNVPLESARQGFVKLYASMEPAGFGPAQIENLFEGISKATAAFGLSSDKVDRVNYAFAQMASKGQIMSEELKGQLGDVLPGALALFAEAAQMSIPEFSKAMEDGAFKGKAMQQVLDNVAVLMNNKFGPAAQNASKTLQGALNQIQNNLKLMYESMSPIVDQFAAAFGPQINSLVKDITAAVSVLTGSFVKGSDAVGTLSPRAQALYSVFQQMGPSVLAAGQNIGSFVSSLQILISPLMASLKGMLDFISLPVVARVGLYATVIASLNAAFQLLARTGIVQATFAMIRFLATLNIAQVNVYIAGIRTVIAVLGSMVTAANIAKIAVLGLKVAFGGLIVGGILVGLDLLAQRLLNVGNSAESSKQKVQQFAQELDQIAGSADVENATKKYMEANTELAIARKENQKALSELEAAKLRQATTLPGEPGGGIVDIANAERKASETYAKVIAATTKLRQARQTRSTAVRLQEEERTRTQRQLKPIDLSAGEDKKDNALKKAQQAAEKAANQQQQLAMDAAKRQNDLDKALFESQMMMGERLWNQQRSLLDQKHEYELAGMNSIEARQRKFQQDLMKIELDRIEIVRKAESETLKAQQETIATQRVAAAAGGATSQATGLPAGVTQYITGDPSSPYYKADHGGSNYHEHLAFASRALAEAAYQQLTQAGVKVTEFKGRSPVGRHTPGSAHYSGLAFDVPGAQVPVGKEKELTARVQSVLGFKGAGTAYTRQRRTEKAGGEVETAQLQENLRLTEMRTIAQDSYTLALEKTKSLIKQNITSLFPVAELQLETSLMRMRNQLLMQGMPEEYIRYQEDVFKKEYEANEARKAHSETINYYKTQINALQEKQSKGIALTADEAKYLKYAEDQIKENTDALQTLTEQQKLYQIASLESAIATMKQADALKAMEEVSGRINDAVTGVTDTYKSMFKEIAMGEDSVEALKKAQQALADQFLTMVFDMAMKPVEESMKNSLSKIFGVPNEEEKRKESINKMQAQLDELKASKELQKKIQEDTNAIRNGTGGGGAVAPAVGQLPAVNGGMFSSDYASGNVVTLPDIGSLTESANAYSEQLGKVDASVWDSTMSLGAAGEEMGANGAAGKTWQQSLSGIVGGLGMAAGSIMGIMAGINQIKEGGTSNVLGGIGMIASMAGSLLGGFSGLFGGGSAGMFSSSSSMNSTADALGAAPFAPKLGAVFANGGIAKGGFRAFANGGVVGGPTLGLMGEGKYNEAIVPLPDGRSIPVQLGGRSARDLMGGGAPGMPQAPSLSMKFETTKINGVEYVSREQLEQAMAETRRASIAGGAQRGMSMTLDKIKQSPSTRSSIGIR